MCVLSAVAMQATTPAPTRKTAVSNNLAHLMPLSSVWAGPDRNEHLDGPPLIVAKTTGSTPFRLSTHVDDVGHMIIVGPTGAGKSVLLSLVALQFRRYPGAQVYIFDKGNSARAAVLAMGGAHHALGSTEANDEGLAFQPLAQVDNAGERSWAAEWIAMLLAQENMPVTPDAKDAIWTALGSLASAPREERTMTGLALLLQSNALRTALQPYTLDGPHGRLLDAAEEQLALTDIQCFETEALMGKAGVVTPVLTYLFHRLEARFDGRPTLLILDEAWIFLDHPLFARAHPGMAEGVAREERRGAVRNAEPGRYRRFRHCACDHRELSAADPAAKRSRDRATGAGHVRALRPERAAGRADRPSDAQAPLLPPVRAGQPTVRVGTWPGRSRAMRFVRSDGAGQDRRDACRAWTPWFRRSVSSQCRSRLGVRADRKLHRGRARPYLDVTLTACECPQHPGQGSAILMPCRDALERAFGRRRRSTATGGKDMRSAIVELHGKALCRDRDRDVAPLRRYGFCHLIRPAKG